MLHDSVSIFRVNKEARPGPERPGKGQGVLGPFRVGTLRLRGVRSASSRAGYIVPTRADEGMSCPASRGPEDPRIVSPPCWRFPVRSRTRDPATA